MEPSAQSAQFAQIRDHLITLYGEAIGAKTFERVRQLTEASSLKHTTSQTNANLSQADSIVITYGDQVREPGVAPLRTLVELCDAHLRGAVSGVHLLPFYPYSSDDGFSVIDYRAVNPALGDWDDVARVGKHFRLMFDAVINHVSAHSEWFKGFLQDDPKYRDYFVVVLSADDPTVQAELAKVTRPRALPLLTHFQTPSGDKAVWTTFSADQIDLNYGNPDVLIEVLDILLGYAARGAEFIRLDAIGFMWKEPGTTCIHLPQTHRIIQLMRSVLDLVAPQVVLITEANVPHVDNISYFGDGANEAQMVYNFALPPLTLQAFQAGDARILSQWAASLSLPSNRVTFFNFLASHDGVGLNPARGILSNAQIEAVIERVKANGGLVSYKHNPDGTASPYELNVNYFDALRMTNDGVTQADVDRFVAAHAIMFSLVGVPGIYFHSLFGSRGWPEGVKELGYNRAINRQKLARESLERELADETSLRSEIFSRLSHLLRIRAMQPAFHPFGAQRIIDCGASVFAVLRMKPGGESSLDGRVLCLINVSPVQQLVSPDWRGLLGTRNAVRDLISGARINVHGPSLELGPYEVRWLKV